MINDSMIDRLLKEGRYDVTEVTSKNDSVKGILIRSNEKSGELLNIDCFDWREKGYRMLVNACNINNGAAGLNYLTDQSYISQPKAESDWYAVIGNEEHAILFAFLPPVYRRTVIRKEKDRFLCAAVIAEGEPDFEKYPLERLLILEGGEATQLIDEFGDICKEYYKIENTVNVKEYGFNTWDYYLSSVTPERIYENLEALKDTGWKVKYAVIDDGWQKITGDWEENEKFGSMERVAEEIAKRGYVPGIWLAPFFVHENSDNYKKLCLVKNKSGETYRIACYGFADITDERTCQKVLDDIRRLYGYGYRIFKLDFLHFLATESEMQFCKNDLPRVELVRSFLRQVKGINPELKVIACGCIPEGCAGIADINRIGGDTAPFLNTTKILAQFLSVRYWMNNRIFVSDPDFLVVRGKETSSEKEVNPFLKKELGDDPADEAGSRSGEPFRTLGESRVWATLVGMSGGIISLADKISALNAKGREIIGSVMKYATNEAAKPRDVMQTHYPCVWERSDALALLNWEEGKKVFAFSRERYGWIEDCIDAYGNCKIVKESDRIEIVLDGVDAVWLIKNAGVEKAPADI